MWKALHQLAIPERLYRLCGCWIPAGGVERAVAGHRPGVGLWLRPRGLSAGGKLPDHVPSRSDGDVVDGAVRRWPSRPSSGWSGRSKWPTWRSPPWRRWGRSALGWRWSAARHGASRCGGPWWIWDARLTSELVLLFLYAGVIALWHAFDDRRLAGRAAGILVLVGVVNLPIIHYSVYWWNTLHQARPTCSKPSTQACVCRCGSASLPSSRCRSP